MKPISQWGVFHRSVLVIASAGVLGACIGLWGTYKESRYQAAKREWEAGRFTDEACAAAKSRSLNERFQLLKETWRRKLALLQEAARSRRERGPLLVGLEDLEQVNRAELLLIEGTPTAEAFLALEDNAILAAMPTRSTIDATVLRDRMAQKKEELRTPLLVPPGLSAKGTAAYLAAEGIDPALVATCDRWPPVPADYADEDGGFIRNPDYMAGVIGGGIVAISSATILLLMGIGRFIWRGRGK